LNLMGLEEDIKQGKKFTNDYEKLLVNIMFTNSWLVEKQSALFKPHGITTPQYNVLRILRGAFPEPCTINTLIDRMLDRMSNASRIVDRLEAKELVERKVCRSDRRAKDVVITEKGLQVLESIDEEMALWFKQFAGVDKEKVAACNEFLDEIRSAI
jgi:DNA-binding MarR family transcriptional regulator